MGRKPIPANLARTRRVAVMLTDGEYEEAEAVREAKGYASLSDLARDGIKLIINEAKRK